MKTDTLDSTGEYLSLDGCTIVATGAASGIDVVSFCCERVRPPYEDNFIRQHVSA